MLVTGQDIHENYRMTHLNAKEWDEVSDIAKRLYESLARAINRETRSIVAVKCPTCECMVDAHSYVYHVCKKEGAK